MIPSFTVSQLVGSYTDVSKYKDAGVLLATMIPSFSVSDLVGSYTNVKDYKDAGVLVQNLIGQGGILLEDVYPAYTLDEIVASNYATKPSMIIDFLELANTRTTDTVSIGDLFSVGLQSAQYYKDADILVKKLLDSNSFSLDAVFPQYPLDAILSSGISKTAIITQLNQKVSIQEFKAENVSLAEFKAASVPVPQLITAFSLQEVVQVFPLSAIVSSGYKTPTEIIKDLQTLSSPPSITTMISAGLTNIQDFTDAGITVSPGFSTQVAKTAVLKTKNAAWTLTNKMDLALEISGISINSEYATLSTPFQKEKTEIVLSEVSLPRIRETFSGKRIPDLVKPPAIILADPTIRAVDFQVAGFTAIELVGVYSTKEILAGGYTSVPSFPALTMGNRLASFNRKV
jgi:hypothetical protein